MATKIDLLPRYVPMRRRLKKWTFAMASVWIAALLFVIAVHIRQSAKLEVLKYNDSLVVARALETKTRQDATTALVAAAVPQTDAVKFFMDAGKTGGQRAELIDQVRRYVLSTLKVDSIDLSKAPAIEMQAAVPSRLDYVKAIDVMRKAELDNVFSVGSTKFSGIRTFNNAPPDAGFQQASTGGQEKVFPDRINIGATLVNPPSEPSPPGAAAPTGAGGSTLGAVSSTPSAPLASSSSSLAASPSSRPSGNSASPSALPVR